MNADMVSIFKNAKYIKFGSGIANILIMVAVVIVIYFFSFQLQQRLGKITKKLSQKLGSYSVEKDYGLQRYIYQHPRSFVTKLYNWVNVQIIALGLKRQGVTAFGYITFWMFVSVITGTILGIVASLGVAFTLATWFILFLITMIMTRVFVSNRIEKRERDVMDAMDLIIPEAGNGIKNAIIQYRETFSPSVKEEFEQFIANVQDRGYTFEDAMYMLSDQLGPVFRDFAQKAVYFEAVGEKEMLDIFTDITETNRLRRQLRDENAIAFGGLKTTFAISALMTCAYFLFIVLTDAFSREFFLYKNSGKVLLVIIVLVIISVLAYITTLKSRTL